MMFSHTLETAATPEAIWSIWTAVDRWSEWDTELKSAQLKSDFYSGATGQLTPTLGPALNFVISQVEPGKSYTFTTQLPLCKLKVHRFLEHNRQTEETIFFSHQVSFEGPLAFLFNFFLGPQFRKALPVAMQAIRQLAESQKI